MCSFGNVAAAVNAAADGCCCCCQLLQGPSFTVEGNLVHWQKWSFRVRNIGQVALAASLCTRIYTLCIFLYPARFNERLVVVLQGIRNIGRVSVTTSGQLLAWIPYVCICSRTAVGPASAAILLVVTTNRVDVADVCAAAD